MPNDPEYTLNYRSGVQDISYMYVYGTEYEELTLMEHSFDMLKQTAMAWRVPPTTTTKNLTVLCALNRHCRLHVKQACEIMFGVCHRKHISGLGLLA